MSFNNSILAGTTLVRENMKSEGFVSGSEGWRITRDGVAEFNDMIARGNTEAHSDSDAGKVVVTGNGTVDNAPTVEYYDKDGVFQLSIDLLIDMLHIHQDRVDGNTGIAIIPASSTLGNGRQLDIRSTRFSGSSWSVHGWQNLSLQNSWVADTTHHPPGVKFMVNGQVYMRGVAKDGVTTNGTTIGTVPSGFEPGKRSVVSVGVYQGTVPAILVIETDGRVRLWGADSNVNFLGLDGCNYVLA